MESRFDRSIKVLGAEAIELLNKKHIFIFGLGGVGGACMEALARGGIGALTIIDNDTVNISNINRQLIATESNLGLYKTDAASLRAGNLADHGADILRGDFRGRRACGCV